MSFSDSSILVPQMKRRQLILKSSVVATMGIAGLLPVASHALSVQDIESQEVWYVDIDGVARSSTWGAIVTDRLYPLIVEFEQRCGEQVWEAITFTENNGWNHGRLRDWLSRAAIMQAIANKGSSIPKGSKTEPTSLAAFAAFVTRAVSSYLITTSEYLLYRRFRAANGVDSQRARWAASILATAATFFAGAWINSALYATVGRRRRLTEGEHTDHFVTFFKLLNAAQAVPHPKAGTGSYAKGTIKATLYSPTAVDYFPDRLSAADHNLEEIISPFVYDESKKGRLEIPIVVKTVDSSFNPGTCTTSYSEPVCRNYTYSFNGYVPLNLPLPSKI